VGTKIDPTLSRADRLVGQVLGEKGKLPEIYSDLEINYFLLRRLLGVKTVCVCVCMCVNLCHSISISMCCLSLSSWLSVWCSISVCSLRVGCAICGAKHGRGTSSLVNFHCPQHKHAYNRRGTRRRVRSRSWPRVRFWWSTWARPPLEAMCVQSRPIWPRSSWPCPSAPRWCSFLCISPPPFRAHQYRVVVLKLLALSCVRCFFLIPLLAEARSCASGSLMVGTLRWCQYESFADLRYDADTEWCVFVWV